MSQDYSRMRYTLRTKLGLHNPGPRDLTKLQWVTRTGLPFRQQGAKRLSITRASKRAKLEPGISLIQTMEHRPHERSSNRKRSLPVHTFESVTAKVCAATTNNGCPKPNTFLITPSLPTGLQNLSQKAFTQTKTKTKTKTKHEDKDEVKSQKSARVQTLHFALFNIKWWWTLLKVT